MDGGETLHLYELTQGTSMRLFFSDSPHEITLGSDGHCTGFPDGAFGLDWSKCCVEHDQGGSDQTLYTCIIGVVPTWADAIVWCCVCLMVAARPIYNEGQRKGWWK
jgi:hypothetical protein